MKDRGVQIGRRRAAILVSGLALVASLFLRFLWLSDGETATVTGSVEESVEPEVDVPGWAFVAREIAEEPPHGGGRASVVEEVAAEEESEAEPALRLILRTMSGVPLAKRSVRVFAGDVGKVKRSVFEGHLDTEGSVVLSGVHGRKLRLEVKLNVTDHDVGCPYWSDSSFLWSRHTLNFEVEPGSTGGQESCELVVPDPIFVRARVLFADRTPVSCAAVTLVGSLDEDSPFAFGANGSGGDPVRFDTGEIYASGRSDDDGSVVFELFGRSDISVSANAKPGEWVENSPSAKQLAFGGDVELVFNRREGVVFTGTVALNGHADGPLGLSFFGIEVLDAGGGDRLAMTLIEPGTGRFRIEGLQPGRYLVRGLSPTIVPTEFELPLEGLEGYRYFPVESPQVTSVGGVVVGWDDPRVEDLGRWLELALVHASWSAIEHKTTLVGGEAESVPFTIPKIAMGEYDLVIRAPFGIGEPLLESHVTLNEASIDRRLSIDLSRGTVEHR